MAPHRIEWLAARANDLAVSFGFLSRLPLRYRDCPSAAGIARAAWAFPIAGALVGALGALVYALAYRAGLPAWPAAGLALAATLLVTGCLHEDGLADTADGFGGGKSREQKLAIMRDSRIGTYGVCALTLSILLRAGALASLVDPALVAWALIAAHAAARATMPVLMLTLPPARRDGLAFAAGRPPPASAAAGALLALAILVFCLGAGAAALAVVILGALAGAAGWLAAAQIEGQTGDVLGALEQVSEVAILLVALG